MEVKDLNSILALLLSSCTVSSLSLHHGGGLVTKLCLTLAIPPGSSVYGISQAIILEWVALSLSRGSS